MRILWVLALVGAALVFASCAFLWPDTITILGLSLLAPGAAAFAITLYERSMQP